MAGQIPGLLFAEHEAQDVLRAMRQIVVGDVEDREPRFGKLGGDSVDRAAAKEADPMTRSYFCRARSERLGT